MRDVHIYCDACHTEITTEHASVEYQMKSGAAGAVNGEVVERLEDITRDIDFHLACLKSLDIDPAYPTEVSA